MSYLQERDKELLNRQINFNNQKINIISAKDQLINNVYSGSLVSHSEGKINTISNNKNNSISSVWVNMQKDYQLNGKINRLIHALNLKDNEYNEGNIKNSSELSVVLD